MTDQEIERDEIATAIHRAFMASTLRWSGGIAPVTDRAAENVLKLLRAKAGVAAGGVALIAAERRRQVSVEGYTAEHDDEHGDGQILKVAQEIVSRASGVRGDWEDNWGLIAHHSRKPDGEMRLLVIAGALIAAEIDRLQRASATPAGHRDTNQENE